MPAKKGIRALMRSYESLEQRYLLAGDFAAGDATRDYFFDEFDLITTMTAGKYATGEPAEWSEGDWNDDGVFDVQDHRQAFIEGKYRTGAYDANATEPVNRLSPFSTSGPPDVTVFYHPATGDLRVAPTDSAAQLTTIQLNSQTKAFTSDTPVERLFDVATDASRFAFSPGGEAFFEFSQALPPGLTLNELQTDLLVDGSLQKGGLGNVRLSMEVPGENHHVGDANLDFHIDEADFVFALKSGKYETEEFALWSEGDWNGDGEFDSSDHLLVFQGGLYRQGSYDDAATDPVDGLSALPLSTNQAEDVLVLYDHQTGDLRVESSHSGRKMTSIHLKSSSNSFQPSNLFTNPFDVLDSTETLFAFDPSGFKSINFASALPSGLTLQQVSEDLTIDGSLQTGGGFDRMRLVSESADRDGYESGDSNRDYVFDQADLIQAFQYTGHRGELTWEGGDWNGDNVFNSGDFVAAFSSQNYLNGPYDPRATQPHHRLAGISPIFSEGDRDSNLVLHYDAQTGDLIAAVGLHDPPLTALHIRSKQGLFRDVSHLSNGLFDFASSTDLFRLVVDGHFAVVARQLLPIGMDLEAVADDLLVDGARLRTREGSATLGLVTIEPIDSYSEWFIDPIDPFGEPTVRLEPLTSSENANVEVSYEPASGDLIISGKGDDLVELELASQSRNFIGTDLRSYTTTAGERFTRGHLTILRPRGVNEIRLEQVFRRNLTQAEFENDISLQGMLVSGASVNGTRVNLAIEACHELVTSGRILGDANLDGVFNSADLVQVFVAREYEDDIAENSTWQEGDWNCDGDFNSTDLIRALEHYRIVAAISVDNDTVNFVGAPVDVDNAADLIFPKNNMKRRLGYANGALVDKLFTDHQRRPAVFV